MHYAVKAQEEQGNSGYCSIRLYLSLVSQKSRLGTGQAGHGSRTCWHMCGSGLRVVGLSKAAAPTRVDKGQLGFRMGQDDTAEVGKHKTQGWSRSGGSSGGGRGGAHLH